MVCHFHEDVVIRVDAAAAESHAFGCAKRIVKSDGTTPEGRARRVRPAIGCSRRRSVPAVRPEQPNRVG